jgi:uncharacterized protein
MTIMQGLVQDFLDQQVVAVVGVSDKRETGANLNYKKFKENGYHAYPVNPRMHTYAGVTCYPDLKSIPEEPGAVFILACPMVTDHIVQQCIELGIKRVWMHCQMGVRSGLSPANTSVSQAAVEKCRANGITVIPGSCPAQFLRPDIGHGAMRRLWGWLGYLSIDGADS